MPCSVFRGLLSPCHPERSEGLLAFCHPERSEGSLLIFRRLRSLKGIPRHCLKRSLFTRPGLPEA